MSDCEGHSVGPGFEIDGGKLGVPLNAPPTNSGTSKIPAPSTPVSGPSSRVLVCHPARPLASPQGRPRGGPRTARRGGSGAAGPRGGGPFLAGEGVRGVVPDPGRSP